MPISDKTPQPATATDADGFKETPTGALTLQSETALQQLLRLKDELASLVDQQAKLVHHTQQIQDELDRLIQELSPTHSHEEGRESKGHVRSNLEIEAEELEAWKSGEHDHVTHAPARPHPAKPPSAAPFLREESSQAKLAKTGFFPIDALKHAPGHEAEAMEAEPECPSISIPRRDDPWEFWQTAWESARSRAECLGLPALPARAPNDARLNQYLIANPNTQDAELHEFFQSYSQFLKEEDHARGELPMYADFQALKNEIAAARWVDPNAAKHIDTLSAALNTWEERMNSGHRWFSANLFDGQTVEALTVAYDCLAALNRPALQNLCQRIEDFLKHLDVFKDPGLKVGLYHEKLPKQLRDFFSPHNIKAGTSADSCKIVSITRNRWVRKSDNREYQVVRPWYELG